MTVTPAMIDDPGRDATSTMHATQPTTFSPLGQRRCAGDWVKADAFATA